VLVDVIRPTAEGANGTLLQSGSSTDALSFYPPWDRLIRVWFVLAASVLLLAVIAKLQWIFSNPLWEDMAIGGAWLTLAGIVLEFWAVSALLLAPRIAAAWVGLGIHFVLLLAGLLVLLTGQTCQCFGDWKLAGAEIPAWLLPVYNLVAVALFALIVVKTRVLSKVETTSRLPEFSTQIGIASGLLFALFLLSTAQGQQVWRSGASATDVILQVREIPELVPGQNYETVVTLRNRSAKPIRVVGGGTTCTCVTLESIPLEIPAHGRRELAIRFKVGEQLRGQKEFTSGLVYYLEGGQQFNVRGVIQGTIDNSR
jgi:hypothetical protein